MQSLARRALFWLLRPLRRRFLRLMSVEDPWEHLEIRVPLHHYGLGSLHDELARAALGDLSVS